MNNKRSQVFLKIDVPNVIEKILENQTAVEIGSGLKTYTALIVSIIRSSHQSCSIIKYVLKNFAKFTGKHLYPTPEPQGCSFVKK